MQKQGEKKLKVRNLVLSKKITIALFAFSMVFITGPVNLLASPANPQNPPAPIVTVHSLYSGSDSYGTLNIIEMGSDTQNTVLTTFYTTDGSSIEWNINTITKTSIITLPAGHLVFKPNSDDTITVTLRYSGRSHSAVYDASGNLISPDEDPFLSAAASDMFAASYDTLTAFSKFCKAENLVTEGPDGRISVSNSFESYLGQDQQLRNISCVIACALFAAVSAAGLAACTDPATAPTCPLWIQYATMAFAHMLLECHQ